jgi:hypothetical protein
MVEALLASRRSLVSRILYALKGKIIRSDIWGAIAVRVLIVAGWY